MSAAAPSPRTLGVLAWSAVGLVLVVIVLGAYTRLTHAGLGCPDWPGCYGQLTWPVAPDEIARANQAFPERPVEVPKAINEMVHRFAAGLLMLAVLGLALLSHGHRRARVLVILAATAIVGLAVAKYSLLEQPLLALGSLAAALGLIGFGVVRWGDVRHGRLIMLILGLILLQALLGKWTVTWKLKPLVVTLHLLGGFTTFALLLWFALGTATLGHRPTSATGIGVRWLWLGLVLLAGQIALGGWTSTNYAALACPDFPRCQGQWWPPTDFGEAFVLWRGIGVNYEGGILDGPARTAIHLSHRIGAVVVASYLLLLGLRAWRVPALRGVAAALLGLLALQLALGIGNVIWGLPLLVATLHNLVAALLLGTVLLLIARTRPPPAPAAG